MKTAPSLVLAATVAVAPGLAQAEDEPRPATLFINYEGARLGPGHDAALDQISCIDREVDTPAFFGGRDVADQTTEEVRAILAPFAVRVVDQRPPAWLPYTMVMVGGLAEPLGLDSGVGGFACLVDCGDVERRETVLVFAEEIREPRLLAQTIVHEAGHSWGLDHVVSSELIMNGTTSGADRALADDCAPLEDADGGHCGERHAMFCGQPTLQDSAAELLEIRGPREPDVSPPWVELLSPADGDRVRPGQLVHLEVDVDDDHPDFGWQWVIPQLEWSARSYGEPTLDLQFPPGEFTVGVHAIDQAGNVSMAEVRLVVQDAPADEPLDDPPNEDPLPQDERSEPGEDAGCHIGRGQAGPAVGLGLWLLALGRARAARRPSR